MNVSCSQPSSIEQLTLKGVFYLYELSQLMPFVPQLRQLSVNIIYQDLEQRIYVPCSILNTLSHVYFTLRTVELKDFEQFIQIYFHQVKVLHLSADRYRDYLDGKRWEHLVSTYIPHLYRFDIVYSDWIAHTNEDEVLCIDLIKQFQSPFWLERQCFVRYQRGNRSDKNHEIFYSTQSNQFKGYELIKII